MTLERVEGGGKFAMTIHPPRAGSVCIDAAFGSESRSFVPSYIGDVFSGLLDAAAWVAERRGAAIDERRSFDWQDEPGSWRWGLELAGGALAIRVERLADNFASAGAGGETVLDWTVPPRRFCGSVLRAMDVVLQSMTLEEFHKEWRGEYPTAKVERLRRALKSWPTHADADTREGGRRSSGGW